MAVDQPSRDAAIRVVKLAMPCRRGTVWHDAVARRLQEQPGVEVVLFPDEDDRCLEMLRAERPQVVVLLSDLSCVHYYPSLAEVFSVVPEAVVLLLCQCDNIVRVYRCQEVLMDSLDAFLKAVVGKL